MKVKLNNIKINQDEYLKFYGYKNPVSLGDGVYEVSALGIQTPAINLLEQPDFKYNRIITQVRQKKGLTVEALANIMLLTPQKIQSVENGTGWFTESELNLCANVLGISAAAMIQGEIRPRATVKSLQQDLNQFVSSYHAAQQSQAYMLDTIQQLNPPERYYAKYSDKQEYVNKFAIYDSKEGIFLKNIDGSLKVYPTAKEALEEARKMNKEYVAAQDKELKGQPNKMAEELKSVSDQDEISPKL